MRARCALAEPLPRTQGLQARRAALQMLDSVLRRGRTLDSAAQSANDLAASDQGLAIAIAGEVLRRMPELDSLIDSATKNRLPDDSKARMVLRIALAQKLALDTPDHALVATALPLVDGGPRRLVHGVLGTLLRRGVTATEAPHLAGEVEQRWADAWGEVIVEAARRQIVARPALDLSFKSDESAQAFAGATGGVSLAMCGWPTRARLRTCPDLRPANGGYRISPRRSRRASSLSMRDRFSISAPRPAAKRCNWPRRGMTSPPWIRPKTV